MDIKLKLKKFGVTLKEFSDQLKISRPTLNSYISTYEQGQKIPREKFQLAFEKLFSDDIQTQEEFYKLLSNFHNLIERDINYGILNYDTKSTDLMTSIVDRMKSDFNSKDFDKDIYIFINTLINSYKEEPILKKFVNCILMMNGNLSVDEISEDQKKFSSSLYQLFINDKNNTLKFDEKSFAEFVNYINRINNIKQKQTKNIEDIIKRKIEEEIEKKIEMGFKPKDINIDELIKNINFDSED